MSGLQASRGRGTGKSDTETTDDTDTSPRIILPHAQAVPPRGQDTIELDRSKARYIIENGDRARRSDRTTESGPPRIDKDSEADNDSARDREQQR